MKKELIPGRRGIQSPKGIERGDGETVIDVLKRSGG
jgi:hypothetical protein